MNILIHTYTHMYHAHSCIMHMCARIQTYTLTYPIIYLPTRYLGCLHILTIINSNVVNENRVNLSILNLHFTFFKCIPQRPIVGLHNISKFIPLTRIFMLFFYDSDSIYIPTNNFLTFLFAHIHTCTYLFLIVTV